MIRERALSGMRPTGALHLGHLCGVLNNWKNMQDSMECYFFVADWHALTTDYAAPGDYPANAREMVITWLAAGIDHERATLFVQSQIPEHAELHVLLSMMCPLSKLMQLPTYKEQKKNLNRNIDTYGFLGYPLLQSADILAYRAQVVPVGEDQLPHVEFTREIARRFNHFYGGGSDFINEMQQKINMLPEDAKLTITNAYKIYRERGVNDYTADDHLLENAYNVIDQLVIDNTINMEDRDKLRGYCRQDAEEILPLPENSITRAAKLLGTDGRKMSKSYDNTIALFDDPGDITNKITRMQTDPARVRRNDPGEPNNCPVWKLHQHFSDSETQTWAAHGCRSADIGCIDCKRRLSENINEKLELIRNRRHEFESTVDDIIRDGNTRAREVAADTLDRVRRAMRLIAAE